MTEDSTQLRGGGRAHPSGSSTPPAATSSDFDEFFATEYARVVRTVFLVVHDHGHAEELAQDAFVQLLRGWARVATYDQPGAWVRRVAIRMAVRAVRRERLGRLLERRALPPGRAEADLPLPRDDVLAAVRELPAQQRAVVVLHYFDDLPLTEVASVLGCAPATARVHLHKARHRLADLLREEVGDVPG